MKFQSIHIKTVLIHILFWVLYIASEYFANLMHMRPEADKIRFLRSLLLSLPILIASTYFIALVAVPRFLNKGRWGIFIILLLVVALFVLYGRIKWLELVNYLEHFYFKVPVVKVLANVIRDYAIIALAVCMYIIGDYRRSQERNMELIKSKAEAEIKLLKGQLHPHFLFNSLNNIYSLALIKSELTADSILKLTELLDYLVYRANMDRVPLSREVQLLNNYIGLEQLRYGDHLQIKMDFQLQNENLPVAPLLLLPFAENCFKHGAPGKDGIFAVTMSLHVDQEKLIFQINNSKKDRQENETKAGGIGLQNIRQRLSLIYPGSHVLSIENQPNIYKVRFEIIIKDA